LLSSNTITEVLTTYYNNKATSSAALTSKGTTSSANSTTSDLTTCSLALAKCSASLSISRSDVESDLMIALFLDTDKALQKHSQHFNDGGVENTRLLVSILHSLARLSRSASSSSPLFSLSSTVAGILLSEGSDRLVELPPRSLSMAAWALSRLGHKNEDLFSRIAELALEGKVCSSWPRWPGSNNIDDTNRVIEKSSSNEKKKIAQLRQESGSPFEPMELAMLTTAIAASLRSSTRSAILDRLSSFYIASNSHLYSNQALVSLACSFSIVDKGVSSGEEIMATRRQSALRSISEVLSSRLDTAASSSSSSSGTTTSSSSTSSSTLTSSSNQEMIYNLVGDEFGENNVDSTRSLTPSEIATALRAFSTSVGPHLSHQYLSATVNYLTTTGLGSFSSEALTSTAFAVARAKFDEPPSQAFWAAVLSASASRLRQNQLRASEVSSILWSLTTSSFGGKDCNEFASSALQVVSQRPYSFSLPALAQTLWACSLQNVYDGAAFKTAFEHIISTSEMTSADQGRKKVHNTFGTTRRDPDLMSSFLLDEQPPAHLSSGVTKIQSQLFTALLGLQLDSPSEAEKVLSIIPPTVVSTWRRALLKQAPKSSRFQSDVSRILSLSGVPHVQEHATVAGLICDILLGTPSSHTSSGFSTSPQRSQTVIEVQGPTHFIRGEEVSNALAKDFSGALTLKADAVLKARRRTSSAAVTAAAEDPLSRILFGGLGSGSTAMEAVRKLLQPTIKTQAKRRWLQAMGYTVTSVDFVEWSDAVSTEEKVELLENKGIKKGKDY
jgi:hypothetical protein